MPEGPEIRRAADRIAAALGADPIEDAWFAAPTLAARAAALAGQRVTAVETRGKAMLTRFDGGAVLYTHNQLYGRWYVVRRGRLPATARSLRVALHTARASALLYSASTVELLDEAGLASHPFLSRLGPDLLDPALRWRTLAVRLEAPPFRARSLASLYLDQGFLAGSGNYLRSEILFAAGLDPWRKAGTLTRGERGRLARATLAIAQRAYATGGITNPPGRVRALARAGAGRAALRFAVFAREGRPCHVCGTDIERAEAASRRLYWCPRCQRRGDAS